MRYGFVLAQYAVPEWQAYSVNYDEFKGLIKNCVTNSVNTSESENVIFLALSEQFDRVNIFVRSKSGELDRRIRNCSKAVEEIAKQDAARTYPISHAQRQRPILRIESEIELIYQELQALCRFVSSHRLAFTKLVKAYNKWSKTSSLSTRYSVLLNSSQSFAKRDFTSTIVELSFLYDSVRRYLQSSLRFFSQPARASLANGDLEFEAASTMASGSTAFWVHNDNYVELEVFLLKYLSIMPNESFFRRNLIQTSDYTIDSQTRIVYVNNESAYKNINSPKKLHDEVARVATDLDTDNSETVLCIPSGATLSGKRKYIESIVNMSASQNEVQQLDSIGKSVLYWLEKRSAAPTIAASVKRTRFEVIGVSGSTVWASLDCNIKFETIDRKTGWLDGHRADRDSSFPYSVLEVRWQGSEPKWLSELRNSHTVFEAPAFNYFAHGASVFGLSTVQPSWMKLLSQDIHKLPRQKAVARPRLKSRTSTTTSSSVTYAPPSTSSSSAATVDGSSSIETASDKTDPFAIKRSAGVTRQEALDAAVKSRRATRQPIMAVPSEERYWNEFDHPEDEADDATFYVDVGEANGFLQKLPVDRLSDWSSSIWNRMSKTVHSFTELEETPASRREAQAEERDGLLANAETTQSSSDLEAADAAPQHALLGITIGDAESVDRALTMFYAVSFSISLVLVLILGGIIFGSAKSGLLPVYVSMLASVGILFAESIAVAGLLAFLWRHKTPGVLHQTAVFLTFITIVCAGAGGFLFLLV